MRLRLFAMALGLTSIVGTATAEARRYYGNGNDGRMERSHPNQQARVIIHIANMRVAAIHTAATHIANIHIGRMRIAMAPSVSMRSAATVVARTPRPVVQEEAVGALDRVGGCGRNSVAIRNISLLPTGGTPDSPSGPRVGAVVVWSHHVGIITGRASNGQWVVKSGNDGNRVRERPQSVAGAVFPGKLFSGG